MVNKVLMHTVLSVLKLLCYFVIKCVYNDLYWLSGVLFGPPKEKKQLSLYLSIYDNIKDKQLLKNNVLYVCFYIAYNIIYLLNKYEFIYLFVLVEIVVGHPKRVV